MQGTSGDDRGGHLQERGAICITPPVAAVRRQGPQQRVHCWEACAECGCRPQVRSVHQAHRAPEVSAVNIPRPASVIMEQCIHRCCIQMHP